MYLVLFCNNKSTGKANVRWKKTAKPLYKHRSPGCQHLPPHDGMVWKDSWTWACAFVCNGRALWPGPPVVRPEKKRTADLGPAHTSSEGGSALCALSPFLVPSGPLRPFFQVSWALMTTRWRCCPRGLCRHLVAEIEHDAFSPVAGVQCECSSAREC